MPAPRTVSLSAVALLVAALAGAAATWSQGDSDPLVLGLLLALVIGADLLDIDVGGRLQISGSFLGLVLAMALLGPGQAAVIGLASSVVDTVRYRPRPVHALSNLAVFAAFPLIGGLVMQAAAGALATSPEHLEYAVAVVAGFAVAYVLNFFCAQLTAKAVDGISIRERIRSVLVPLLPSEAVMVLLAGIIVYAEAKLGGLALAMLVALFFLYLVLIRELLLSQERARLLEERTERLAALQVGVLTTMVKTLSLRDRMTARHSAAVARYAREIARAAGCTEEQQELVHTAGLLHDIGKFAFPDRILLADRKLDDDDWAIVKTHPYQGAKLVRQVDGYGPVADIILCHHERIDGKGYPRGIAGDAIPLLSRMISIADTYDVMTARDSYRDPVSSDEAIAELRRVSGAQLDGRLVELFVEALESREVAFRHADDADFEAELAFDRRVADFAVTRLAPAAA